MSDCAERRGPIRSKILLWLGLVLAIGIGADPAAAQDAALLDYRDRPFRESEPRYDADERARVVSELIGPDLHGTLLFDLEPSQASRLAKEIVILGHVDGAFTAPARRQRVYLLARGRPIAAHPASEQHRQILAVLENGKLADAYLLPKDVIYQRLVGGIDADGDGRSEIWAEASFYHMGQTSTSLDLLRLGKDNVARPLQRVPEVYVDSCETPGWQRERSAKSVAVNPDPGGKPRFEIADHTLSCDEHR